MPMEVATARTELSSMELNAQLRLLINVLVSQAPTGTEPTVSASPDSQQLEAHAIVMVFFWVTIVKNVRPNLTQYSPMEFVNVTTDMLT